MNPEKPSIPEEHSLDSMEGLDKQDVAPQERARRAFLNLKSHYQLFNSDEPDLTQEIETTGQYIEALDAFAQGLDNSSKDLVRDIYEVSGSLKILLNHMEQGRVGKKPWFSIGNHVIMANRDSVAEDSKTLYKMLSGIADKYSA